MTTTNYAWSLPIVGGNQNQWGTMLNTILTDIDAKMVSKTDAQTLTNKTLEAPVITGGASISGNVLVDGSVSASGPIESGAGVIAQNSPSYNASSDMSVVIGGSDNGFVNTGAISHWRQIVSGDANGQNLVIQGFVRGSGYATRATLDASGNIYVPGVYGYTTANAANMYVFSDGQFARSTSSAKYKKDVETLESEFANKVLELRPVWYRSTCGADNARFSYYGFIAEEAAKVDPRFVHWKFPTKTVELEPARTETKTVQRQKTVTVQAEQIAVEVIDGQARQVRKVVDIEQPVFDYLPVFDTDGNPVLEVAEPAIEAEVLDDEGNVVSPAVAAKPAVYRQALHQVPVLEDVTETVEIPAITRTEIDYSGKPEAEGFQYERIVVPLQAIAARHERTIAAQAETIAALIARIEALEARA